MAQFGLLPTPKVPQLKSPVMKDYIGKSYYPIPFQIANIVESCNVGEMASWNINVNAKNIKFNIDWNIGNSANNGEIFPKSLVNTISTYNIEEPAWSTSFTNTKLSLKIEWKLIAKGQIISPDTIITPLKNTPARSNVPDLGYSSFNSTPFSPTSTNRHNSSFPRSKLFPDSPVKHDVYRPNSLKKHATIHDNKVASSSKKHLINPSAIHENSEEKVSNIVPPSAVNIESQTLVNQHIEQSPQNTSPVLNTADTASSPTSQPPTHLPDLTIINPPELLNQSSKPNSPDPTSKPVPHNTNQPLSQSCNTTAIPELVDTDYPLPQPFSPTKPNTSNLPAKDPLLGPAKPKNKKKNKKVKFSKVPPNPHPPNPLNPTVKSSDSGSTLDSKSIIPTPNTFVISEKFKPNSTLPSTPSMAEQHVSMIQADLKFVVHKDSTDDQIMLVPDPLSPEVNPYEGLFLKTPDDLHVNDQGLIDPNIKAGFMDLEGRCRLCHKVVRSYDVDEHLLDCPEFHDNDLVSLVAKISKTFALIKMT